MFWIIIKVPQMRRRTARRSFMVVARKQFFVAFGRVATETSLLHLSREQTKKALTRLRSMIHVNKHDGLTICSLLALSSGFLGARPIYECVVFCLLFFFFTFFMFGNLPSLVSYMYCFVENSNFRGKPVNGLTFWTLFFS